MPVINKINLFLPINPAVKNRQENIQKTDFSGFTGNKPVSYSAVSAENFKAYSVVPASRVNLFPSKIGFSGKFYEINTGETAYPVLKIEENPELGYEPVLFHSFRDKETQIPDYDAKDLKIDKNYKAKWIGFIDEMEKTGKYYQRHFMFAEGYDKIYYAIYYKDTGKWNDNNGKGYEINSFDLIRKVIEYDKKEHNQPLIRCIAKGTTKGKVVVNDFLSDFSKNLPDTKEPIIAIVKKFNNNDSKDAGGYLPPNVKGIIFTRESSNVLSHNSSGIRRDVNASAMVYDNELIKNLTEMNGKFIELQVAKNKLNWKPIDKPEIDDLNIQRNKIEIPEIITTDKLLKSSEYKPELVGAKAFNLRRMEEMKEKGKLKDVIIPKSFAIPCGIFEKVLAANPEITEKINNKIQDTSKASSPKELCNSLSDLRDLYSKLDDKDDRINQELDNFRKECGLREDMLMVRSSFNGEDAKNYSAAGHYSSYLYDKNSIYRYQYKSFLDIVKNVWTSKWNNKAYMSRINNNIDHDIIKPTVIIQDYIDSDYKFTIYTKDIDDDNKVLIEMHADDSIDPYIIKYDKTSKELEIESLARRNRKITVDENFKIINADPINDPVKNNLNKWMPLLKKVCDSALEVENEFGTPQDIEGGIKLGEGKNIDESQIYFWQTRDQ